MKKTGRNILKFLVLLYTGVCLFALHSLAQETEQETNPEEAFYPVGSLVYFGSWPKDAGEKPDRVPVEWIVLDSKERSVLLLSLQALDCRPFDDPQMGSLNSWLNGEFLQAAFDPEEHARILSAEYAPKLPDSENPDEKFPFGQVFLLSGSQAEVLFAKEELSEYKSCKATAYAKDRGIWTAPDTDNCWWWLGSEGHAPGYVKGVGHTGIIGSYGTIGNEKTCGVRPALWVREAGPDLREVRTQTEETNDSETGEETFREGMQGPEVENLQAILFTLGYFPETDANGNPVTKELAADGDYGPMTTGAVKAFQEAEGLAITGILDSETIKAIEDALNKQEEN